MSNGMDARLGTNLCIFAAMLISVFLACAGCNQKDIAVDLYVDAVMFRELDENEMAVESLNGAIASDEKFSPAYSMLGEIYKERGEYEKSAVSYEKSTQLNPWSFNDHFSLGNVYETMRKYAEAVKAYVKACELKPDHLQANVKTAKCYYETQDYDNALAYGHRAEKIDANVAEVQKILGDIYEFQKSYDQAISSYKRALEVNSNDPDIMTSLAVAYLKTNRDLVAKELLTSAVKIRPNKADAHQYLGYCSLRLNDIEGAIDSYNRAVEIDGLDWQAYRGLGVALMLKGLNGGDEQLKIAAVRQWEKSLEIKPDQPRRKKLVKLIKKYSQ